MIEGLPAGLALDFEEINRQLKRRQGGYGRGARQQVAVDCLADQRRRGDLAERAEHNEGHRERHAEPVRPEVVPKARQRRADVLGLLYFRV